MAKWVGLFLLVIFCSCGDDKVSLSGDAPVDAEDFVAAFNDFKTPKTIYDSSLRRLGDTTVISTTVFSQFVPDTALAGFTPGEKKTIITTVGKIRSEEEQYLLAKFTQGKNAALGVFVFDLQNKYLASKELLTNHGSGGYSRFVSINREPTFIIGREKALKDNQQLYTKTGYAFTRDVGFMVVVNDSNEDTKKTDSIINPIDTFPRLNKYSGDYIKDRKNFISIRDGRNPNTYLFFVHFEKNKGECVGELKAEMTMRDATTAQYTAAGDPCVINFSFSGSQVKMKEEGSCGNHRGIKCFFDDRYTKKKEGKPRQKKK
ncbi:MAG TPA: hypothetical protein VF145_10940 [Chitinophagaceae bacterium]